MDLKFIRLGKYTINLDAIAYIDWNYKNTLTSGEEYYAVRIYLRSTTEDGLLYVGFRHDSVEAKALHYFFNEINRINNPDIVEIYSSIHK